MPVVVESTTITVNDSYSTSLTLNMPATRPEGDVYVACLVGHPVAHSAPGGSNWNQRGMQQTDWGASGRGTISLWTLTGGASEPASYTWTASATSRLCGYIVRLSGANEAPNVVQSEGAHIVGTASVVPSLSATPTVDGCVALRFVGLNRTNLDTTINGAPAGTTDLGQAVGASTGSQQYCAGAASQSGVAAGNPGGVLDFPMVGSNQRRYGGFTAFFEDSGGAPPPSGNLKIGSSDISTFYVGSSEVSKIYLGVTEIWGSGGTPVPPPTGQQIGWGKDTYRATAGQDELRVVNTLADDGPGSLRNAIETASAPTLITFDPSLKGWIDLASGIDWTTDRITIDGSTAAGHGVGLRMVTGADEAPLLIKADHFNINNLHVRPGAAGITGDNERDVITIKTGSQLTHGYLKNISGGWGADGLVDITRCDHVTFELCCIAHPLSATGHPAGFLWRYGSGKISAVHNIFGYTSSGLDRMPSFRVEQGAEVDKRNLDWINNLTLGDNSQAILEYQFLANCIGNVTKDGTGTKPHFSLRNNTGGVQEAYIEDNQSRFNSWTPGSDNWADGSVDNRDGCDRATVPFELNDIVPMPSQDVEAYVKANAGASDDQNTLDVKNEVHPYIIADPSEVGGWATL